MAECRVLGPDLDRFCGQPATYNAGRMAGGLPCCDDCREYLLHNNWPWPIRKLEEAK